MAKMSSNGRVSELELSEGLEKALGMLSESEALYEVLMKRRWYWTIPMVIGVGWALGSLFVSPWLWALVLIVAVVMALITNFLATSGGVSYQESVVDLDDLRKIINDHRAKMLKLLRKLIADYDVSIFSGVHDDAVKDPNVWNEQRRRHRNQVQMVIDHVSAVMERYGELGKAHAQDQLVDDTLYEVIETYTRRIVQEQERARLLVDARHEVDKTGG